MFLNAHMRCMLMFYLRPASPDEDSMFSIEKSMRTPEVFFAEKPIHEKNRITAELSKSPMLTVNVLWR